ncbi:MAG: hypothetical protein GY801_26070 [bacterium]|nr:hypothetical protein [bacterium]
MKIQPAQHKLSNLQLELLKLFHYELTDQELLDIKDLLARYFAQKATDAMEDFWESHNLHDAAIDEWLNEHQRTPYV